MALHFRLMRTPPILASFSTAAALLALAGAQGAEIFVNQIGYYPDRPKVAFVEADAGAAFEVVDAGTGEVAFEGALGPAIAYADGGLTLREADFSEWTEPGEYFLRMANGDASEAFSIGSGVFAEASRASLKSFFFNRASQAIGAEQGGPWARPLGHPDTSVRFHSSTGRADGFSSAPKGWYDAGDYGKYVVNGGYALGTLLSLHELLPDYTGDATGIPESGNGASDLLDEARWEMEWFLKMQDADGGVFHKLTTLYFVGFVMPHQTADQRYFIGKSVTATLNFAACAAQAARAFDPIDAAFAEECLEAAERAWTWAKANPGALYLNNPDGVSTGAYGDGNASDEFIWAAAQLFLSTGEAAYASEFAGQLASPNVESAAGWPSTRNLGLYSLATVDSAIAPADKTRLQNAIVARASAVLGQIEGNPIRSSLGSGEFYWGSNGVAAAKGVLLAYAFRLSGEQRFADGMAEVADYLLGRNATGYCFLTGFGWKSPQYLHHRPSGADGVAAPVPGFLAGGPNRNREDASGVDYPYPVSQPARSYADVEPSYASNEIAINWNAPLVLLLAALEDSQAATFDPQPDFFYGAPEITGVYGGVLNNDSSNPDSLVATLVEGPLFGELQFSESGDFVYSAPDFYGNVYFTYKASNGVETSAPITVTLSVAPIGTDFEAPNPSAYDAWLLNYPDLEGDDAAADADPDGDGISNLWESLAFLDPARPDAGEAARLIALPPTADSPLRARLRIAADHALRGADLRILARLRLDSGEWLPPGAEGAPELSISAGDTDPETGLSDLVIESEGFAEGSLFLRAEATQ